MSLLLTGCLCDSGLLLTDCLWLQVTEYRTEITDLAEQQSVDISPIGFPVSMYCKSGFDEPMLMMLFCTV